MGHFLRTLRPHTWAFIAAALGVMALWDPVILYLVALAVFGLPHVLWEMAWVRQTWAAVLPRTFLWSLFGALAVQASARFAVWTDRIDAGTAALCDAVTLALALMAALTLFRRARTLQRLGLALLAITLPAVLIVIADTPHVMGVLAALAIAHNFTPIGLVPGHARIGRWPARSVLVVLFAAPVGLFLVLWLMGAGARPMQPWTPAELGWAQGVSPAFSHALLPALVWAQCLHYLAVLYLLPRAIGPAWKGLPWRLVALGACALLLIWFALDFSRARGVYAIAAGVHAWIEWPLILLALLGLGQPGSAAPNLPHLKY